MLNLLLFNGPPRSGKDTAAMHLFKNWQDFPWSRGECHFERMSFPNKAAFAAITQTEMDEFHNNLRYENIKGEPLEFLKYKSYRQFQIDFSETFMKPCYGQSIFARLLISRLLPIRDRNDTVVIPDCGFQTEVDTLSNALTAFSKLFNVHLIRVVRPGFDFSTDSRSYVMPGSATFNIVENNDTQEVFEAKIEALAAQLIGEAE